MKNHSRVTRDTRAIIFQNKRKGFNMNYENKNVRNDKKILVN